MYRICFIHCASLFRTVSKIIKIIREKCYRRVSVQLVSALPVNLYYLFKYVFSAFSKKEHLLLVVFIRWIACIALYIMIDLLGQC